MDGSTIQPEPGGMKISTPILAGIIGAGVLLLVILVAVPVLIFARSGKAPTREPQADTTTGAPKGGENAKAPGRSDAPDPRFKDAAEGAKAALSDVDYSKGPNGESLDYKEWVEEGHKIKAQGFRRNRRFIEHGLMTVWYPTGEKKSERYWFNGKTHGHMVGWYKNGQKEIEGDNRGGYGEGYSVGWYENGSKKFERVFKNRKFDGLYLSYYRNGHLMREVQFVSGRPKLPTEQWFDAEGARAAGPTVRALSKDDFVEIMDYLLREHTGDVSGQLSHQVYGGGRETYDITANFTHDFYMKFFGKPGTGYDPDFANHALQTWTYDYSDGVITMRVEYVPPRVIVRGIAF